jgi:ubiquinone/menaquinone biosynthesis C-methylase UbiE
MLIFDDATSGQLEATHQTPDVVAQRQRVLDLLGLRVGEHVLDVGTGPGYLTASMAEIVGSRGSVTGVDPSPSMLKLTAARQRSADAAPVLLRRGNAEALPFGDSTFDVVVAVQVLEYVDDVTAALLEARRVLRPGGRMLIVDTDWESMVWHSRDEARMFEVQGLWRAHAASSTLPRGLVWRLKAIGLKVEPPQVLPLLNTCHEADNSFSARLIDIVAAFARKQGMASNQVDAWIADLRSLGDEYFFSLNRYVFLARRGGLALGHGDGRSARQQGAAAWYSGSRFGYWPAFDGSPRLLRASVDTAHHLGAPSR